MPTRGQETHISKTVYYFCIITAVLPLNQPYLSLLRGPEDLDLLQHALLYRQHNQVYSSPRKKQYILNPGLNWNISDVLPLEGAIQQENTRSSDTADQFDYVTAINSFWGCVTVLFCLFFPVFCVYLMTTIIKKKSK